MRNCLETFWIFLGNFLDFHGYFGGIFLEDCFGGVFWEDFFVYIVKVKEDEYFVARTHFTETIFHAIGPARQQQIFHYSQVVSIHEGTGELLSKPLRKNQ